MNVDLLVTKSEMKTLASYVGKFLGGFEAVGLKVIKEGVVPISGGAFSHGYHCRLSLPIEAYESDLLLKVSGGHVSCSGLAQKEPLLGRARFLLKGKFGVRPLDASLLTREQRLLLDRLQMIISERSLIESPNVLVRTNDFLQNCETLLRRHFLIDGAIDSVNSTSEAVFNYCMGVKSRSYKAQHWHSYLDSAQSVDVDSLMCKIMKTSLVNSALNSDIPELLNMEYIDRAQANRLALLIDSHLLSSSVRIKDDFLAQVMELEPSNDVKVFNGVIFGVAQNISSGKPRYALRVKSEDGQLMEVESGSECFGGMIAKEDLIQLVRSGTPVKIEGIVTSVNKGVKIRDRIVFPAITTVVAKKIGVEAGVPILKPHLNTWRKFG